MARMRILFTCSPGVGHVLPILPVAAAAAARGHKVVVGCGASLAPIVARAGHRHVALGPASLPEARAQIAGLAGADPRAWTTLMYVEGFGGVIAAALADDTLRFAEDWHPAVIVHEDLELGSWIAAERLGIPHVTIQATAWRPWQASLQFARQNDLRVAHGLAPQPELAGRDGQQWFTTRPRALRDPAWPMPESLGELRPEPDDRVGGDVHEVPDWLARPLERPRVAVTLGTVNAHRIDLLRPMIDGLAALDVDVVVALGADPATLGAVPANVRVEPFVPMSLLLPRSSVAVHHAGSGTMLAALAAGVPSVLVPMMADQPDNAAATVATGAGLAVEAADVTAETIAAAVQRLLDEAAFADRARAVATEIAAMPDADAATADIERIVSTSAPWPVDRSHS